MRPLPSSLPGSSSPNTDVGHRRLPIPLSPRVLLCPLPHSTAILYSRSRRFQDQEGGHGPVHCSSQGDGRNEVKGSWGSEKETLCFCVATSFPPVCRHLLFAPRRTLGKNAASHCPFGPDLALGRSPGARPRTHGLPALPCFHCPLLSSLLPCLSLEEFLILPSLCLVRGRNSPPPFSSAL